MSNILLPPTSFQGGKQRLNKEIYDFVIENVNINDNAIYDICCGSGSVGLYFVEQGHKVNFLDSGLYGLFYEKIGDGSFDLSVLRSEIDKLPNIENIQNYLKELSNMNVNSNLLVYHYLLLQAGAFGSKQIWVEGDIWKNNTFRSYWTPTLTSNRKSHVNPMMPMPLTLYSRVEQILHYKDNINGYHTNLFNIVSKLKSGDVVYIDPPYLNTTGYKDKFNIYEFIKVLPKGVNLFISEGFIFNESIKSKVLHEGRKKGNISGTVIKEPIQECISYIKI